MRPIVIYTTDDPTVPDNLRCIAKFKDGVKLLPLIIHAATPDAVRAKAEQWWRDEEARQERIGLKRPGTVVSLLPPVPTPNPLAMLLPR